MPLCEIARLLGPVGKDEHRVRGHLSSAPPRASPPLEKSTTYAAGCATFPQRLRIAVRLPRDVTNDQRDRGYPGRVDVSPSRRDLLRLLAAAPVLLAVDPAGAAGPADGAAAAPRGPTFDDGDLAVLRALLATIFGAGSDATDALSATEEGVRYLAPDRQVLISFLPRLFDQGHRLFNPTLRTWTALPPEDRTAALEDWATSSLALRRQIYGSLRQLLLFHAYTDPATWDAIGYPGPWLGRFDLPVHPLRFGEPS